MEDINELWKQVYAPRRIELPSGLPALIRPVTLQNLVMAKRVPLTLVRKMESLRPKSGGGYKSEDMIEMAESINAVCVAALVAPRVTADGADGTVSVEDIDWDDRLHIFAEANRPASAYAMFPGGPQPGDDAAPDGEGVRPAAE